MKDGTLTCRYLYDTIKLEWITMVDKEARLGMGGAPPKIGIFIRDFLVNVDEASPTEIHKAYKREFKGVKTLRGRPYRLGTYRSHVVYIRALARADLVERTGRTEEPSDPIGNPIIDDLEPRVYFRLTSKGRRAPDMVWLHPLRLFYYPYDWERAPYGEYIKEGV